MTILYLNPIFIDGLKELIFQTFSLLEVRPLKLEPHFSEIPPLPLNFVYLILIILTCRTNILDQRTVTYRHIIHRIISKLKSAIELF